MQIGKLYWRHVGNLLAAGSIVYSDGGSVFIVFGLDLCFTMGTPLYFSTAHHPQSEGVIKKMKQLVVCSTLRCVIHELSGVSEWKAHLMTVKTTINSLPNRSTEYIPIYLNYVCHPVAPCELTKGDENEKNEVVSIIVSRPDAVLGQGQMIFGSVHAATKEMLRQKASICTVCRWVLRSIVRYKFETKTCIYKNAS